MRLRESILRKGPHQRLAEFGKLLFLVWQAAARLSVGLKVHKCISQAYQERDCLIRCLPFAKQRLIAKGQREIVFVERATSVPAGAGRHRLAPGQGVSRSL